MNHKPSNPIGAFFGSNQKQFTYPEAPDCRPFFISGSTKGWIPISVLVFASSKEDARAKFMDGLKFLLSSVKGFEYSGAHAEEFKQNMDSRVKNVKALLDGTSELEIEVSEGPMNQFYKVGWADNDTIFGF